MAHMPPHDANSLTPVAQQFALVRQFLESVQKSATMHTSRLPRTKTSMALALAAQIGAEIHHIPSQKCNAQAIDDTCRMCAYVPLSGGFHLVIVDEADRMTPAAQLALLSKLDATDAPPNTIWVFTCNATDGLEPRFLSRTRQVEFSSYGMANEAARLLESIWQREANGAAAPNFARIVKESANNLRDALMCLETELLAV